MRVVDTHTHIYLSEDFPDGNAVVQRALEAGVVHMVLPCINASTIAPIRKMHSEYPECTSMALGLHPEDVKPGIWNDEIEKIREEIEQNLFDIVAIGEVGIDLYWDKTNLDIQQQAFARQLEWAQNSDLPVIIHSREAFDAIHEVLKDFPDDMRLIFHSYTGDIKETERILSLYKNAWLGINGIVTFKNSTLKEILPAIPLQCLLLETDSPYLAPVPRRGKTNESAYIVHTARFIADSLNMDVEKLADITTQNAADLFRIKL